VESSLLEESVLLESFEHGFPRSSALPCEPVSAYPATCTCALGEQVVKFDEHSDGSRSEDEQRDDSYSVELTCWLPRPYDQGAASPALVDALLLRSTPDACCVWGEELGSQPRDSPVMSSGSGLCVL
jgi:hypothetical protein